MMLIRKAKEVKTTTSMDINYCNANFVQICFRCWKFVRVEQFVNALCCYDLNQRKAPRKKNRLQNYIIN